jgi:hypothetical protein
VITLTNVGTDNTKIPEIRVNQNSRLYPEPG